MDWSAGYLTRLLGRNPGRSLLSLLLAVLLAAAVGLLTDLRGMYAALYRQVEVRPVFTGLGYDQALKTEKSGYVRAPYYETVFRDGQVELKSEETIPIILVNSLSEQAPWPVEWAEGWDEETFFASKKKVCVLSAAYGESLGKGLGDKLRVNEQDWLSNLLESGKTMQSGETLEELRDRLRPSLTVVGLVESDREIRAVYCPVTSYEYLYCFYSVFNLDIARYTLADYHRAGEFRRFAKGLLDGQQGEASFYMDTDNADRIYQMYRLLETLYPLTVAAALLLGGVLPGLIVLHAARELSILRALGVKVRRCVGIYTLAQVLCALAGLVLGFLLVLLIRRPEPGTALRPLGLYLAAYLAACAVGSGVFAWLCARKHVLAQLQAKE